MNITVSTKEKAWQLADKLFPTDYMKDEHDSPRAGYPVFNTTSIDDKYTGFHISDLNTALELNMGAETIRINIVDQEAEIKNNFDNIQNRVITQDEEHNDIIEQYYECPICGTHYTITITDRVQRIAIQKRRQLQTAVKNAIRARRPARAQTYKNKEKELADDIQARAKMLKEQYAEYTEE